MNLARDSVQSISGASAGGCLLWTWHREDSVHPRSRSRPGGRLTRRRAGWPRLTRSLVDVADAADAKRIETRMRARPVHALGTAFKVSA